MRLPDKVRILDADVRIVRCKTRRAVDPAGDAVGLCLPEKQEIRIYSRMKIQRQWKTLVHEVIHYAIAETNAGAHLREDAEESFVGLLEHPLYGFLLNFLE